MANIKTILDTRRAKSDGTFNIILELRTLRKFILLILVYHFRGVFGIIKIVRRKEHSCYEV